MKKYGLINKNNGNVIVLERDYNGDDRYASCEYSYSLREEKYDLKDMKSLNNLWLLSSPKAVMTALNESTDWFNADSPERPNHYLNPENYEILEVEITFQPYKDRSKNSRLERY